MVAVVEVIESDRADTVGLRDLGQVVIELVGVGGLGAVVVGDGFQPRQRIVGVEGEQGSPAVAHLGQAVELVVAEGDEGAVGVIEPGPVAGRVVAVGHGLEVRPDRPDQAAGLRASLADFTRQYEDIVVLYLP